MNRRVLQVFEPHDGGVPEHVLQLALGLGDHGFEADLAGPPAAQIYDRAQAAGVPIHRFSLRRDYRHPGDDIRAGVELLRLVRVGRYGLVHCHSAKAGAIGRVAARAGSTPAIYTPHCFGFVGEVSAPRRMLVPQIERALASVSARIVCVSRDEMQLATERRIACPERLALVHYGTPAAHRAAVADPKLAELRSGGPLIANIGALRRQKRHDVFLEATAVVLASNPQARIALVGSGPLDSQLRYHASKLGLDREPRFSFLPFQPPVERYLTALDGIVLCSDWEALPISLLEALAWGVPQVASAVSGTPEIVTSQTGFLVPPGDPTKLADGMLALLDPATDRCALSLASRARHQALFSLERMLAKTAALYEQILDASARQLP